MSFFDNNNRYTHLPEERMETSEKMETFNFPYNGRIETFKGNFNSNYTEFYTTFPFQGKEKDAVIKKKKLGPKIRQTLFELNDEFKFSK